MKWGKLSSGFNIRKSLSPQINSSPVEVLVGRVEREGATAVQYRGGASDTHPLHIHTGKQVGILRAPLIPAPKLLARAAQAGRRQ